jgi:LuxR family maltose regulon positive regulatory protein
LRLAQDDPGAVAAALAPVLEGSASGLPWSWLTFAFLLEASARDALGDQGAAGRALDLAEPDGALCCTRCRSCWNARPGTAPPTPR